MADATDRRAFLWGALALPGAALAGCRSEVPLRDQLVERLGLEGAQRRWLNELTPEQQQQLLAAMSPGASKEALARAERLVMKVIGPRDRLFAFVGYPPTARRRTVCDGLLRE